MSVNLDRMTPEELRQLKGMLDSMTDTSGRSPIRPRQLHDLRLLPTKDDPRPMFDLGEPPRNMVVGPGSQWPRLMWSEVTGEEITVHNQTQMDGLGEHWTSIPPSTAPISQEQELAQLLESLSPEDRKLVIESQQQDRMAAIQAKLASLSPAALESLLTQVDQAAPAKRKPGRPRKIA